MRPKRQRALERLREAEKGLEDALGNGAALLTYNDICEVLDSTDLGCRQKAVHHVRIHERARA